MEKPTQSKSTASDPENPIKHQTHLIPHVTTNDMKELIHSLGPVMRTLPLLVVFHWSDLAGNWAYQSWLSIAIIM